MQLLKGETTKALSNYDFLQVNLLCMNRICMENSSWVSIFLMEIDIKRNNHCVTSGFYRSNM